MATAHLPNGLTAIYGYAAANRLTSVIQGRHAYPYTYSGNGDRRTQSVEGVVTRYTLALNAGLIRVLSDGTNTYFYSLSRIGEQLVTRIYWSAQLPRGEIALAREYRHER